jgi:glycosyltransferase involved in cell wall biosynthesis
VSIHNGIDLQSLAGLPVEEESKNHTTLSVGMFSRRKGFKYLIDAMLTVLCACICAPEVELHNVFTAHN